MLVTISDKKIGVDNNSDGIIDYYNADVITANDYYPFGSQMPGRKYSASSSKYRYGFNGKEKSDEVSGEGNAYNFDARMYNPRIGRWFSADAKGKAFSSPYNYVQNNPINRVDPDGNDDIYFVFLYDKTIPSLSHLTKFSVIVRNNEPNRYIHRTYFLTSGKGGITDQVLSAPKDKEFYPANWSSSSGLTSTKVFGFLNADDKDFVTLGKYLDEFADVKREANYTEIGPAGAGVSQRVKNAQFLGSAIANNEKRKQDVENEAAGMSLVKGVVGWAAGELLLAEIVDAVVVSKIVNSANNAVKGLKYENIGAATYKQTMAAGRKFVGDDATVIFAKDGTIESLESANGLKQFRAPRFKGEQGRVQANFETRPSTEVKFSRPKNNTTNAHLDVKN